MSQRIHKKTGPQSLRAGSQETGLKPDLLTGAAMEIKYTQEKPHPSGGSFTGLKRGKKARSLGPVADLEAHVDPEWWRNIFNSLYLKTDADVLEAPEISAQEVELFIKSLSLSPKTKVLDLCCGQGRHALEMARRGFLHVEGIDRSAYLIRKARERAKKAGLAVRFREGDARALPYEAATFEAICLLGNSFGYFASEAQDLQLLKEAFRVLKPGGELFIDLANGEWLKKNFQARSWEWGDGNSFVCRERALSADKSRLISRELITQVEKGVIADNFYAERLYSKKSLANLLLAAGFKAPIFHGDYTPKSQKNQDLGMMGNRILLSARAEKPLPALSSIPKRIKNVLVILGDPRRKDIVRPALVFDEDDFKTIAKLKKALSEISGIHFTYLDDHATLIEELKTRAGKIDLVLNLCDEGFENDPLKELHIPALLDQLKIPYTGAGPRCLAFCYDKSLVRGAAREMEIPVAKALFLNLKFCPEGTAPELPFEFPVIVKPNSGDSSFGITQNSVAHSKAELSSALMALCKQMGSESAVSILIEEYLPGKDVSIGIIGNASSRIVLPITAEDYSEVPDILPRLCGYEAKWLSDSPYWKIHSVPAELSKETETEIIKHSLALFSRLECRDYARFDWRLDSEGKPRLLEVNPNPGWCWDGHLAKMAAYAGKSYSEMLKAILEAAEKRVETEASKRKIKKEKLKFQTFAGKAREKSQGS